MMHKSNQHLPAVELRVITSGIDDGITDTELPSERAGKKLRHSNFTATQLYHTQSIISIDTNKNEHNLYILGEGGPISMTNEVGTASVSTVGLSVGMFTVGVSVSIETSSGIVEFSEMKIMISISTNEINRCYITAKKTN